MELVPSPSQTVGPFFHLGVTATFGGTLASPDAKGERVRLICRVFDGDGAPVPDALIELWQANAEGKYHHPDDPQNKSLDPAFRGFGRMATSEDGSCIFDTIKPGQVPSRGATLQAPHVNVSVFARGILKRLATRIYFSGDPANAEDPVIDLVPADRRASLMARPDGRHPGTWQFDVNLCGKNETVFFDI
jgi:protocatechuate 3,4-dioxygenase alpha subunit